MSDTTARKEFGLTIEEIRAAMRAGKLQYREGSLYGNPWFRLLRREVEALVESRHGSACVKDRQKQTELAAIDREVRHLKERIADLETRRTGLLSGGEKP